MDSQGVTKISLYDRVMGSGFRLIHLDHQVRQIKAPPLCKFRVNTFLTKSHTLSKLWRDLSEVRLHWVRERFGVWVLVVDVDLPGMFQI